MGVFKKIGADIVTQKALRYVEKDPETNIPKLAEFLTKHTKTPHLRRWFGDAERYMKDEKNPYRKLILRAFSELAPNVRREFIRAFVVGAGIENSDKFAYYKRKYGVVAPWACLIDPTSACNLKCTGCWAAEYNKTDNLDYDTMNRIIHEGKKLGTFFYLFSGGEPLMRKKDLLQLACENQDCFFCAFTNSTLVDEQFAKDLAEVGNFALAISVEGTGEATDFRRGKGTYDRIMKSMDLLHAAGVPFGFSTCYHAKNVDAVSDENYLDFLIKKGCMFGWFFTYIPCGKDAVTELMTRPEQRELMFHKVRDWRTRKPIFLLDFWNDGDYVEGCIAGGRAYFHINAAGDVEPCAFIHYSDMNIKDHSYLEVLKSPLFKAYQDAQPFNTNHLQPCPLLDNPEKLRGIIHQTGARSTQPLDAENVDDLTAKCEKGAAAWKPVADRLWSDLAPDYNHRKAVKDAEKEEKRWEKPKERA